MTRLRGVRTAALLVAGACAQRPQAPEPVRGPGAEPSSAPGPSAVAEIVATRPWSTADGTVTVRLPASWTVEPQASSGREVLALWATVPPARSRIGLYVYAMTNSLNARGRLVFERDAALRRYGADDAETHVDGDVPWCVVDDLRKPEGPWRRAYATRMIRGNQFLVRAFVRPDAWAHVEPAFVAAARTLETTLPEWPERPEDLRDAGGDRWTYLLSAGVRDDEVAPLDAFLRQREEIHLSRTGPFTPDPEAPVRVLVYGAREHARAPLGSRVAFSWIDHRWLFARVSTDDTAARAKLAGEWEPMLWARRWGESLPWWIHESCGALAESEVLANAPLPAATARLAREWPSDPAPFAEVVRWTPKEIYDGNESDVMAYLAVFRAGPPEIRAAWDACVKEAAATYDWQRAQRHLLALDAAALREAVTRLGRDLVVVEPR